MPSIKLNVNKLRAYTLAPFHVDSIREAPQDNIQYVRQNGSWVPLDITSLGASLGDIASSVQKLQRQLDAVDIKFIPSKNQLIFIDGYGNETVVTLPGANVDGKTVGLNDTNALYVIDTADEKTIKITDIETIPHPDDASVQKKVSGKLRVEAIYAENGTYLSGKSILNRLNQAEKNISDLEVLTQGTGGFLDPQEFYMNELNPSDTLLSYLSDSRRNTLLTIYAKSQKGEFVPDQTKIKDTKEGYIWVWNGSTWLNDGLDSIVTASNKGILGVVTGVEYNPEDINTKFKISIIEQDNRSSGKMEVNGLADEFEQVVYKKDASVTEQDNSYVQRTAFGTIRTKDSIDDFDAINKHEFKQWQVDTVLSDEDIVQIVNQNYLPKLDILSEVH